MFNLHDFVMDTLMGMVGHEPDYKVRQYALGWYDKAQLTPEDMAELLSRRSIRWKSCRSSLSKANKGPQVSLPAGLFLVFVIKL